MPLFAPALRAITQLDDAAFLGVLLRSVAWAAVTFALLAAGIVWGAHAMLANHGLWAWLAALLGGAGAAVLALFMFLPLAAVIATLFVDRVAEAVERRYYPGLPAARAAPLSSQIWDGIALGLRVFGLQILALVLALRAAGRGLGAGLARRGLGHWPGIIRGRRDAADGSGRRPRRSIAAGG